ncbi:hypothetical protein PAXINDRAFT_172638 [Paxillus involutus ATCC 200175]|uniref:Unplaced genomic scaffold PAXINscaffold_185, whole genome shotgun sequence n=1 Tax=Paxillus involutus ATCC 200175 TaxID=664439 RepID=A0A0C9TMU7_PAXIN|nr:hypothetical protein PAXINDRAFT_172638 [Paxillus involutus ATCC 200175]
MTSHLHSMFRASSGCSSLSELHPRPPVGDQGGRHRDLTTMVKRKKQFPIGKGGFGDIWQCDLIIEERIIAVAVKAIRAENIEGETQYLAAQKKKLHRELKVWDKLQHKNVVELLGVVSGFGVLPSMVSPWFSNGSLSSYLSHHKAMDLSTRQGLLFDVASGLFYLHSQDVVHGDLHGVQLLLGRVMETIDFPNRAMFLLMKTERLASQTLVCQ